jgi:hypothetical protein
MGKLKLQSNGITIVPLVAKLFIKNESLIKKVTCENAERHSKQTKTKICVLVVKEKKV